MTFSQGSVRIEAPSPGCMRVVVSALRHPPRNSDMVEEGIQSKMSYATKKTAMATLLAVGVGGSLLMPMTARASEEGDRNSTYVLGALAGILGSRGNTGAAVIAGAGAAVAEQNWRDDIYDRHRRDDYYDDRRDRRDRYDRDGCDSDGYYRDGYNRDGFNRDGYSRDGYNRSGYRVDGYDRDGYNRDGYRRNEGRQDVRRDSRRSNRNDRSDNRRDQRRHDRD